MSDKPLVSVIILCYNYGQFLHKAIESALAQTLSNREIIVVDNGSTDDTADIVKSYRDKIKGLRLEKNAGRSGGKNAGLRIATGEYIQFLDADDTLMPEKLEKLINVFSEQDQVDVVYSDSIFVNEHREPMEETSRWYRERHFACDEPFIRKMLQECFLLTHDGLIRKSAIDAIGGFDESQDMLEDWDLWLRLTTSRCRFFHLQETLAEYYFHSASVTKDPKSTYILRKNFVYKHLNNNVLREAVGDELYRLFRSYQHAILASNLYNLREWRASRHEIIASLNSGGIGFNYSKLTFLLKVLARGAFAKLSPQ